MRAAFVLSALLAAIACGDGDNVQYRPIGEHCDSPSECGTRPFTCITGTVGGYCTKDCMLDGDCPADSGCEKAQCRRRCTAETECRVAEGYTCLPATIGTNKYCLTPPATP